MASSALMDTNETKDKKGAVPETTSDDDSDGDEKIHSEIDGTVYVPFKISQQKSTAFCVVYTSEDKPKGTGVIGKIKINDQDLIVLLTNYHVIAPQVYKKAMPRDIPHIKHEIEEEAQQRKIKFGEGELISLSEGMLVNDSSKISPRTSLDYFIMAFDDTKLREKLPGISAIDLNHPAALKKDDQIQIRVFQCPQGGPVSDSTSSCRIAESRDVKKANLLVYCGGTEPGSSGGLVFKAVNMDLEVDLEVVGLHRGGVEYDWDGQNARGYNYGSSFVEIIESIKEDWHPLALNRKDPCDKEEIYRAVDRLP